MYVNIYHRIRLILTTGALVIFGTSNFPSDITNKSDGSKKSSDTPVWDSPAVLWGAQKMPQTENDLTENDHRIKENDHNEKFGKIQERKTP